MTGDADDFDAAFVRESWDRSITVSMSLRSWSRSPSDTKPRHRSATRIASETPPRGARRRCPRSVLPVLRLREACV